MYCDIRFQQVLRELLIIIVQCMTITRNGICQTSSRQMIIDKIGEIKNRSMKLIDARPILLNLSIIIVHFMLKLLLTLYSALP